MANATTGGIIRKQAANNGNGNATTTALTVGQTDAQVRMKRFVNSMLPAIQKALPSVLTPERFTRIVLTVIGNNPKLASCEPSSFAGAMMQAAQLGLEPNTPLGQAYLIPYGNRCQFQLGYKGLIDLAYRSGEITDISAHEVHENDTFEYELGLEPKLKHVPARTDRGAVILYYAVFHTKSGGYGFEVMSIEDIKAHAKQFSQSVNNGPWVTNFDEMAKKTVIKKCLKYAPIKTEFMRAIQADETVKNITPDDVANGTNILDITPDAPEDDEPETEETGEVVKNATPATPAKKETGKGKGEDDLEDLLNSAQ